MHKRNIFQLTTALVLAVAATVTVYIHSLQAQHNTSPVTIQDVKGITTTMDQKLYKVKYSYAFADKQTVYIRGVGQVPASGTFTYLTHDQNLEFRDSATGPVLASVPVAQTTVPMGPDKLETPCIFEFPDTNVKYQTWNGPASAFATHATTVLNSYYPLGQWKIEMDDVQHSLTGYRGLDTGNTNLIGQVAVDVAHPYSLSANTLQFRVRYLVRERKKGSDEWETTMSSSTQAALSNFLTSLVNDLTKP